MLAGKEKLCLIRPKGDALALETLFLAEDVKGQDEIDEPVAATGVKEEELALARQIISGLEGAFEPAELQSGYRAKLRELLVAKLEGHEISEPEPDEAESRRWSISWKRSALRRRGRKRSARRRRSPPRRKRAAAAKEPGRRSRVASVLVGSASIMDRCAWKSVLSILPW